MTTEEKAANVAMLADRVMGWVDLSAFEAYRRRPFYPYTSIADAMEMLDKSTDWDLHRFHGETMEYSCEIEVPRKANRLWHSGFGVTAQEAICAACLEWARAQGEKG